MWADGRLVPVMTKPWFQVSNPPGPSEAKKMLQRIGHIPPSAYQKKINCDLSKFKIYKIANKFVY